MRLAIISFTRVGSLLCGRLVEELRKQGEECLGYVRQRDIEGLRGMPGILASDVPVTEWTGRMFDQTDGLIYIGAAGIAVRAIAPWLKDKMTDPAVVCVDEQGRFAISLLSGHVGGANELAGRVAGIVGATPVVTTASDGRGLTAIDVWAKEHGLLISDRLEAKRVVAAFLDGEAVGFFSDFEIADGAPRGYAQEQICRNNVWVTARRVPEPGFADCHGMRKRPSAAGSELAMFWPEDSRILRLIPKVLSLGIGCRKKTACEAIEIAVRRVLESNHLDIRAVYTIASVDLKKEEPGLVRFAGLLGVPFVTFSAEELESIAGDFTESEFVRRVTGSGSVCERAAVLGAGASGAGRLLVRKTIEDGVTVAVACSDRTIRAKTAGRMQAN
ncbi:MAG: cobalt-precorrin 5A hydrolase [Clostridiales bacterium]|nr:cobalt-precorrin 5A hydrolase [Clostridiales bacterium]